MDINKIMEDGVKQGWSALLAQLNNDPVFGAGEKSLFRLGYFTGWKDGALFKIKEAMDENSSKNKQKEE